MTKLTLKLFLPIMNLTISEERILNIKIHIEMFFSVMDTVEEETEIVFLLANQEFNQSIGIILDSFHLDIRIPFYEFLSCFS